MTEKAIHASIRRLYSVASEVGDDAPAKVARRLNISAQTLNNWEARGISQAGALSAQDVYGCDAVWVMTGKGARVAAGVRDQKSVYVAHSQPLRLDPVMIAETHRALRELEQDEGRKFSLEDETCAARFVLVYEMRTAMPAKPTQDDWVQFGRKLAAIMTPTGGDDGRGGGVPAEGTGTKKMAQGLRRKG